MRTNGARAALCLGSQLTKKYSSSKRDDSTSGTVSRDWSSRSRPSCRVTTTGKDKFRPVIASPRGRGESAAGGCDAADDYRQVVAPRSPRQDALARHGTKQDALRKAREGVLGELFAQTLVQLAQDRVTVLERVHFGPADDLHRVNLMPRRARASMRWLS